MVGVGGTLPFGPVPRALKDICLPFVTSNWELTQGSFVRGPFAPVSVLLCSTAPLSESLGPPVVRKRDEGSEVFVKG